MTESIKVIITLLLTKVSMIKAVEQSSKKDISWYPVLKMSNFKLGLSDGNSWVVSCNNELSVLNSEQSFGMLISILELAKSEVVSMLIKESNKIGPEINFINIFPFYEIVKAGFEQNSDYWSELAFRWYEGLSEIEQKKLVDTFEKVSDSKWASQKIRQRMKKELKKLF